MQLPDDSTDSQPDSTHSRTLDALPAITAALARGEPVVLGLVLTSTAAKGNVGFPYQPEEVAHFATMLAKAKVNLTDADVAALIASLHAIREADAKKKAGD
jgi:hypothetical protein